MWDLHCACFLMSLGETIWNKLIFELRFMELKKEQDQNTHMHTMDRTGGYNSAQIRRSGKFTCGMTSLVCEVWKINITKHANRIVTFHVKEINTRIHFIKHLLLNVTSKFYYSLLQHFLFATESKLPSVFGVLSKDTQEKQQQQKTQTLK